MAEESSENQHEIDAVTSQDKRANEGEALQSKATHNTLDINSSHLLVGSEDRLSRIEEIKLELDFLDKRKQFDIEIKREEIRLQE